MLKLTVQDIQLNQTADGKQNAIKQIAADLADKGLVATDYVAGMLDREGQNSTYLGNGIAIPHGTTDTRSLVMQTGVVVHHFPKGVNWGGEDTVYVAIGIAAKSDEHLAILKQLTRILSADGVEQSLKAADSAQQLLTILNGDLQTKAEFHSGLIQQNFPAADMQELAAVGAGLLKNNQFADAEFVHKVLAKQPTYLGKGVWLVASSEGALKTAMSVVTPAEQLACDKRPLAALITMSVSNFSNKNILTALEKLIREQQQEKIISESKQELIDLLTSVEGNKTEAESDGVKATFTIKNAHGLHARPGAMLVAEAKKYESAIRVANLDGDGGSVNAKSLMKVIALGVKKGHSLQFTAEGGDAELALQGIGAAIESGLGEG